MIDRTWNLVRGWAGSWIGRRERRNPDAVYESAIRERVEQYGKLRAAAAGVLYMRSKLAKELEVKAAELARVKRQLEVAVDADDDVAALALITRRDGLAAEVERLNADLGDLTTEADGAKQNLIAFQNQIVQLREEKVRMLARLANAKARLRLQETLSGLSPEADIRALETVREYVNRLATETSIARDVGDAELEKRLGRIREAEADAAARAQLEEMKRGRRRLVPMVLPAAARPAHA